MLLTVEGLCIMCGVKPSMEGQAGAKEANSWQPGKKFLGNPKLFGNRARSSSATQKCLGQFDKDYIPDKTIKAIQPFIENPDFVQGNINLASKACVSLWIRAMHTYHFVARSISKENITTPPKHHHP